MTPRVTVRALGDLGEAAGASGILGRRPNFSEPWPSRAGLAITALPGNCLGNSEASLVPPSLAGRTVSSYPGPDPSGPPGGHPKLSSERDWWLAGPCILKSLSIFKIPALQPYSFGPT